MQRSAVCGCTLKTDFIKMSDLALPSVRAPYVASHRANEFFLARQPILDRRQQLVAFELLFRAAAVGDANVTDDVVATASVIAHASELGLENVLGSQRGFINVDAAVLMSDIVYFLPRDRVVLEILETVQVTDNIARRVRELVRAGYSFALDDVVVESKDVQRLLPLVDIIKIDISDLQYDELRRLSERFKTAGKKLLAEKVEKLERFEECMELGFDYFQGYYFAKPLVLTGKKLSPSEVVIVQLMAQLADGADLNVIEQTFKRDATLGLSLLRLVNAPGASRRIDSIHEALMALGKPGLKRWMQILLHTRSGRLGGGTEPLLMLATTRGRLLELIARKVAPANFRLAGVAFTVGLMSLMDALFGMPLEKILAEISVSDEVRDALLQRKGICGDVLKLVESIEKVEECGHEATTLLQKLGLSGEELNELQVEAFKWWNNNISQ